MKYIRKHVLGLTQAQLAAVVGRDQATVSRWEAGAVQPSRDDLDAVRSEAMRRQVAWSDAWFFEVPVDSPPDDQAA